MCACVCVCVCVCIRPRFLCFSIDRARVCACLVVYWLTAPCSLAAELLYYVLVCVFLGLVRAGLESPTICFTSSDVAALLCTALRCAVRMSLVHVPEPISLPTTPCF